MSARVQVPEMTIGAPGRGGYPVTYHGEQRELKRTTSIIGDSIVKPWLAPWAAKVERELMEEATFDVLRTVKTFDAVHDLETWRALCRKFAGEKKAHRRKLEEAGDVGTLAHLFVQNWNLIQLGCPQKSFAPATREQIDAAAVASMAWEDWSKSVHWRPIACEFPVAYWPHYAGTIDAFGTMIPPGEGERVPVLVDYKTSARIYDEHILQVGGYVTAYQHTPTSALPFALRSRPISCRRAAIVRLPKSIDGDVSVEARVLTCEETAAAARAFDACLRFRAALAEWRAGATTTEGGEDVGEEASA